MNEHCRGALLGLAVGDALGTTFEFERLTQPAYPVLATGPATDVTGGGPFTLTPGQVTDDTQLAVCLARSLHAHGGLDLVDLAGRYVAWMKEAFDIGNQTHSSISRISAGEPLWSTGLATWRASGRRAAGNGSLMRTAPLAVALRSRSAEQLIEAAILESGLTHADPRCLLACAAYDRAIAEACLRPLDGRAMVEIARAALPVAAGKLESLWAGGAGEDMPDSQTQLRDDIAAIGPARAELERDLEAALAAEPGVYGGELDMFRTAGYVRVAFRLAFWHAVHTASWREALVDVASRGGDADTNAAIVGALLGARDGEVAIPEAWRLRVLSARQPGSDAWADAHHPRHMLALA